MKILIVNKSDLSIATKYDASEPSQHLYGGPWGSAEQTLHIACPAEMDDECVVVSLVDGEYVVSEDSSLLAAKSSRLLEQAWESLRSQRDAKLAESDRYMLPDYPISAENKSAMEAYRNSLRDLPSQISDPRLAINWPVKPLV